MFRKAVVVEQQARLGGDIERRQGVFPMPRNHQHSLGSDTQRAVDASEVCSQPVPHVRRRSGRIHEEARTSAVRDEQSRQSFDGGHRNFSGGLEPIRVKCERQSTAAVILRQVLCQSWSAHGSNEMMEGTLKSLSVIQDFLWPPHPNLG